MSRPLPRLTSEGSREFYEGAREGRLKLQRCADCLTFRFPPQLMCAECRSTRTEYVALEEPRGRVVTFVVVPAPLEQTMPMGRWPAEEYPIIVVISELEGAHGARIVTGFPHESIDALEVGLAVEYDFVTVDDVVLPQARPAGKGSVWS